MTDSIEILKSAARRIGIQECIRLLLEKRKVEIRCEGIFFNSKHHYCDDILKELYEEMQAL